MTFLINTFYTIVPTLLVLGLLVFAHELGHYWAARRAGMKVHEFAIGMGPVLWSTKRAVRLPVGGGSAPVDDTIMYSLRAIPLGGFVRIGGMEPGEDPNEPGSFNTKPWAWRFITLIAGCVMNFVLAAFLFCLLGTLIGLPTGAATNEVDIVMPNTPAAQIGLQSGDRLLSVAGVRTDDVARLRKEIESHPKQPIFITFQRGNSTLTRTLTPAGVKEDGKQVGRVGIQFVTLKERKNPVEALSMGMQQTWGWSYTTVKGLSDMLTSKISVKENVGGPVKIFQQTGQYAKRGIDDLIIFAAILSINLGIFNLLPIPALDGGRLIFLLLELVRRGRRVDPKKEAYVHAAGMVFLLMLILLITYKDVAEIVSKWKVF